MKAWGFFRTQEMKPVILTIYNLTKDTILFVTHQQLSYQIH